MWSFFLLGSDGYWADARTLFTELPDFDCQNPIQKRIVLVCVCF